MDTAQRLTPSDWDRAIEDTDGRQLVVAGPGTGKTEFLIRRIAHLIQSEQVRPETIAMLSFSRRATGRLKARIEERLDSSSVPVDVSTFHSLALRLSEAASPEGRPVPLTTPEQVATVRSLLRKEDPGAWPLPYRGILDTHPFAAEVSDFFLRCSERLPTPSQLAQLAAERADWKGLPELYARYLDHLADIGRTDYGVLLTQAVELLQTSGHLHEFRYVLVDEYQDTSPAQAKMAQLLAREGNITVAGDPYQSIYSFRGAELRNIADYIDGATKTWILGKSFRVPEEIMEPALRIVAGGDLPGSAGPVEPADHPGSTETYVFDQETAEAEWIASDIERIVRTGEVNPADIAVVVRSKKSLVPELSRALSRRGIRHDPPDSRLVDHPAVQVIHDVVTIATADPTSIVDGIEADAAMRRLMLGPLFGLSIGSERQLARSHRLKRSTWAETLSAELLEDSSGLIELLADTSWATERSASLGFWHVWSLLDGIHEIVESEARSEWRRAWAAFGQMLSRQNERDESVSLSRFFELVDEDDFEATPLIRFRAEDDRVSLTTLHQVKGLEFDTVYIANAVEGVFPDLRRSRRMLRPELLSPERTADPHAQHLFQVQEEMRLAYTAMTRSRRRVVWTATDAGIDQGENRPSRFLLAASSGPPSAPDRVETAPTTVREVETRLRRILADPSATAADRLAATLVLATDDHWEAESFAGVPERGPESPVLGSRVVLSPSQAESYAACPRKYVLERKLRLGEATSVWSHFGDLCHEILEVAESEIIDSGQRHADLERVLEILEEVWADRADFGFVELTLAWKVKAVEMITRLYDMWPGKGPPLEVELAVESEIAGVTWVGRVDRVEAGPEGLRVVDYKTGTTVPTQDKAAESIQLGFYAWAVQESLGDVAASEMWFPRKGERSITTRGFAMFALDQIRAQMEEITANIVAERWAPRVGSQCKRCAFKSSCPAWPEGREAYTT